MPTQQPYPHEEFISIPNITEPKPSQHRVMSSRALGEHTEKIRNSLSAVEIEGEYAAALKGAPCEENTEMLQRSAIAVASSSMTSDELLNLILSEGVNCLNIKSMGGMLHLLIFDTYENKKCMMESQWLLQWFMSITNVNDHSVTLWRETWISIYGVPLFAWGYENFHNIGSIMGRVISVEYDNYDCAKILIFTDCLFDINCKISLEIAEESYPVFVTEKNQNWRQVASSAKNVKIKSNISNDSSAANSGKGTPTFHGGSPEIKQPNSHNHNDKLTIGECADLGNGTNKSPREPPLFQFSDSPEQEATNHNNQASQSHQITTHQTVHLLSPHLQTPQSKNQRKITQISPQKRKSPTKPKKTINPSTVTQKKQTLSPISIHNNFAPLLRHCKPKSSSSTLGSSSCSGPLFPPGFEDRIPNHTKLAQERKRNRKMEKKKRLKLTSVISQPNQTSNPNQNVLNSIHTEDVINMANILGLSYDGPMEELKQRIDAILANQKQSWVAHQA